MAIDFDIVFAFLATRSNDKAKQWLRNQCYEWKVNWIFNLYSNRFVFQNLLNKDNMLATWTPFTKISTYSLNKNIHKECSINDLIHWGDSMINFVFVDLTSHLKDNKTYITISKLSNMIHKESIYKMCILLLCTQNEKCITRLTYNHVTLSSSLHVSY